MSDYEKCFYATALSFAKGQLQREPYLDNLLAHLRGARHPNDANLSSDSLVHVATIDVVAGAIRNCIMVPSFETLQDTTTLKKLLLATWDGNLPKVQASIQEHPRYFQRPLVEVFVAIAFVQEHVILLKYLLNLVTPPPINSIFDKMFGKSWHREKAVGGYTNLDRPWGWIVVLDAGWYHQDLRPLGFYAVRGKNSKAGIALLKRVFKTDSVTAETLLHEAVTKGPPETAKYVIKQYLASNPKSVESKLMWFARLGVVDYVEPLLDYGVDVNWTAAKLDPNEALALTVDGFQDTASGETALMEAALHGYVDIVELLLQRGANKDLKNARGKTARDIAKSFNKSDVVTLLSTWDPSKVKEREPRQPAGTANGVLEDIDEDEIGAGTNNRIIRNRIRQRERERRTQSIGHLDVLLDGTLNLFGVGR